MSLEIVLTNIQLLLARPEASDLQKIRYYAAQRGTEVEEVSYIVKLYTQTPMVYNSMGVELYVGDHLIRQYSQFKNGIYFKVNDPQQLTTLQGEEVRFRRPGAEEFINTGVRLPAEEVVERSLRTVDANQLPSQSEILRE
ncbi:MAG TPA: hypothetical protein IGS53_16340 [Leptolyngbyaceae cyanobacterium M33_DOE_097]|uniref:Uncharacterized protein n=1 Tax=Oscillatoriales cyanobacterium SpSt-418 TaxID=2282169 RepID=A0A7C3PRK7_9CYAN|nr:hypothetical protein [Leptolyngbyaceae cyanobacterium M33_DOE_097]